MKAYAWIIVVIWLACVCACSSSLEQYGRMGGRGQGFRLQPYKCSAPASLPCPPGITTGKITRIAVENFAEDPEPGIALDMISCDGEPVHVHVSPLQFMEKRESDFRPGDTVTLQGVCYHQGDMHYLIATKMTHKDHTVDLCNPARRP